MTLRVPIYEVLIMKAETPDRAGNVYTKKALKEAAAGMSSKIGTRVRQGETTVTVVGTRLVETEKSAELYMQYQAS